MYNLKNVSSVQEPFPVSCCNADVMLDKAEYVKAENGNEYLDFYWTDGKHSLRDRRFPVSKDNLSMMKREGETSQQTYERLIEESSRVYRLIASRFCSDQEVDSLGGNSFKEFAQSLADLLNKNSAGVKLYMKTVLNKAGYVSLPKAGRFLQNMSEGNCTLSYTKKELEMISNHGKTEGIREAEEADLAD